MKKEIIQDLSFYLYFFGYFSLLGIRINVNVNDNQFPKNFHKKTTGPFKYLNCNGWHGLPSDMDHDSCRILELSMNELTWRHYTVLFEIEAVYNSLCPSVWLPLMRSKNFIQLFWNWTEHSFKIEFKNILLLGSFWFIDSNLSLNKWKIKRSSFSHFYVVHIMK